MGIIAVMTLSGLSGCIEVDQRGTSVRHPARESSLEANAATPAPPSSTPSARPLLVGAAAVLATSWVVSTVSVVAGPKREEECPLFSFFCGLHTYSGWLVVPVAGPFLAWTDRHETWLPGEQAFLITATVINTAALGTMFVAAASDNMPPPQKSPRSSWSVTPMTARSSAGALLTHSF